MTLALHTISQMGEETVQVTCVRAPQPHQTPPLSHSGMHAYLEQPFNTAVHSPPAVSCASNDAPLTLSLVPRSLSLSPPFPLYPVSPRPLPRGPAGQQSPTADPKPPTIPAWRHRNCWRSMKMCPCPCLDAPPFALSHALVGRWCGGYWEAVVLCCLCLAGLQVGLGGELGAHHTGGLDGVPQGGQHLADKSRGEEGKVRGRAGQGRAGERRAGQGRRQPSPPLY
jgi:hypothetical protein